ncbi:MAG: RraA family protein, partial [Hyphomicrobiaceae bacterium]
ALSMAEPAQLTIRRDFPRPSAEQLKPFETAPTGWVVDAQGRRGALPHWIRPLSVKTRFFGPALTVRTRPVDNLAPYAALKFAKPGDILVVAVDGSDTASVIGDLMLGMARNAGIAAAVTDGVVRDIDGIDRVGIPVFARALTPNSPLKDGPGEVGVPVTLGGVAIAPGDLVVGDVDGVVVVARARIADVGAELAAIAAKEAKMEAAVKAGAKYPAWLDDILKSPRVHYLD